LIYYLEAFHGIFGVLLRNEDPQNLEEAQVVAIKLERNHLAACELPLIYVPNQPVKETPLDDLQPLVVTEVQEVCVIEDEPQLALYQVPKDEQEGDSPILDDLEPIVAPFESQAEFQEDEGEDVITLECSWIPPISEDEKFQEDEPQVNHVEINQRGLSSMPILEEASSLPITAVVQEQLDQIPLQHEEPILVQLEDDVPYTLPTIPHHKVALQGPEIDQRVDIKVHHDPVELKMMEVFQQIDAKSSSYHAFMLVTVEIPCYKSQPAFSQRAPFTYGFTNKYFKATLGHMRFHGWSPWKVDCANLSRRNDHLVAWLQWSFEYDDLIMATWR